MILWAPTNSESDITRGHDGTSPAVYGRHIAAISGSVKFQIVSVYDIASRTALPFSFPAHPSHRASDQTQDITGAAWLRFSPAAAFPNMLASCSSPARPRGPLAALCPAAAVRAAGDGHSRQAHYCPVPASCYSAGCEPRDTSPSLPGDIWPRQTVVSAGRRHGKSASSLSPALPARRCGVLIPRVRTCTAVILVEWSLL